jgi:dTDP-4-dehydrorhamnose reductase
VEFDGKAKSNKVGERLKIVVTGAEGQLGKEIVHSLQDDMRFQVLGFDRQSWDVTNPLHTAHVVDGLQPDVIIHCAAYTKVDQSEHQPEMAYRVNVEATRQIAEACNPKNVRLVYISTDYVFSGENATGYTEEDGTYPINQYGKTKRFGEEWVQKLVKDHLILRTSWLYGPHGHNFVRTILRRAINQETIRVIDDQIGSPTYTGHLANYIKLLLPSEAQGIYHTANTGGCSWYQFAKTILTYAKIDYPIQAITSTQLQRAAKRPACSILRSVRLQREGFALMPYWKEGLKAFLQIELGGVL